MLSPDEPMLSSEQSRAARGWLDWTQEELAKRAGVSLSTVRDFERTKKPRTPIRNNREAMRAAFERAGLNFIYADDGTPTGITWSGAGREVSQANG